jgi:hypothetical protein
VVEETPHVLPTKTVGPSTKRSFQVVGKLRENSDLLKLEKHQRSGQQGCNFLIGGRKPVLSRDLLIDQMIEVFLGLHVCAPLSLGCDLWTNSKGEVASVLLLVTVSPCLRYSDKMCRLSFSPLLSSLHTSFLESA